MTLGSLVGPRTAAKLVPLAQTYQRKRATGVHTHRTITPSYCIKGAVRKYNVGDINTACVMCIIIIVEVLGRAGCDARELCETLITFRGIVVAVYFTKVKELHRRRLLEFFVGCVTALYQVVLFGLGVLAMIIVIHSAALSS